MQFKWKMQIVIPLSLKEVHVKNYIRPLYNLYILFSIIQQQLSAKKKSLELNQIDRTKFGTVDDTSSRNLTFREIHEFINGTLVKNNEYKKFLNHIVEDSKENTAMLINLLAFAMNTTDDFQLFSN